MSHTFHFAGTRSSVLIGGGETEGRYALILSVAGPDSQTPPHSHDQDAEIIHVLGGGMHVEEGGEAFRLNAGDTGVLRARRPHRLSPVVDGPAPIYALLCVPAGFDRFVQEVGEPAERNATPRPMTGEEQTRLVQRAAAFGVRLLDPARLSDGGARRAPEVAPGKRMHVMGADVEVLASLGAEADDLCVMRQAIPNGIVVPMHSHADPECFLVIEGALEVFIEAEGWRTLRQYEAINVPPAARHAVRNVSGRPTTTLMISSVRMAAFFEEIAAPRPTQPAPAVSGGVEKLFAAAASRGYWLGSAAENAAAGITLDTPQRQQQHPAI